MASRIDFGIRKESASQLASFILTSGLITEQQLNQAVIASDESNRGLMETILEFGFTVEEEIAAAIGGMYELELTQLGQDSNISKEMLSILPANFIQQNRIIPFDEQLGAVKVAISEPHALNTIPSVSNITNKKVTAFVVTFSEMYAVLHRLSQDAGTSKQSKTRQPQLEKTTNKKKIDSEVREEPSSEVVIFVDKMIGDAAAIGASDIHIEPYRKFSRVRYRKDGVLQEMEHLSKQLGKHYAAVSTRIKIMATLNIAERRLPQDGAFSVRTGGRDIDVRVSILPTSNGERVVMRLLDTGGTMLSIETMGFQEKDETAFRKAIDAAQGLVLVTGPTGSGKSTTLYAALNHMNDVDINILTAEDPVEYTLDGVGQVQVREDIGLSFASALRSFLRQDPEVIMVGEIRDKDTADIAIKAALTGHRVLSTIHTNDAVSTVTRFLNMGIPPYLIASSLTAIVAQRLARKLCDSCRQIDEEITAQNYRSMGFTHEEASRSRVYKGAGCDQCDGTGYSGRRGIYEVLTITESVRQGILEELTSSQLLKIAIAEDGYTTMQNMGRGLMVQGEISATEYQRVLLID